MPIVIVATIVPVQEQRDAVGQALQAAAPHVHQEPGCQLYALHSTKPGFVLIEQWADGNTLKAHGEGSAYAALTAELDGKLVSPMQVQVLRPVVAGDPVRGQLAASAG